MSDIQFTAWLTEAEAVGVDNATLCKLSSRDGTCSGVALLLSMEVARRLYGRRVIVTVETEDE